MELKSVIAQRQENLKRILGPDYIHELSYAAKFRDRFLSPETIAIFEGIGLFDCPSVICDFINGGKALESGLCRAGEGKLMEYASKEYWDFVYSVAGDVAKLLLAKKVTRTQTKDILEKTQRLMDDCQLSAPPK